MITYCSISGVKSMKLHSIGIEIFTIEYCLRQPNYVLVSRHLNYYEIRLNGEKKNFWYLYGLYTPSTLLLALAASVSSRNFRVLSTDFLILFSLLPVEETESQRHSKALG